jgi:hypothetical protein
MIDALGGEANLVSAPGDSPDIASGADDFDRGDTGGHLSWKNHRSVS